MATLVSRPREGLRLVAICFNEEVYSNFERYSGTCSTHQWTAEKFYSLRFHQILIHEVKRTFILRSDLLTI